MSSRELSPVETFFYWRLELKYYSNFRVGVEFKKPLSESVINETIERMCIEYTNLRTNVSGTGDKVRLQVFDVNIESVLEVIDDESMTIEQMLNELENRSFEYHNAKPLWKLILLNKTKLIFYSDHLVFDGMSGYNFHAKFLEMMNETAFDAKRRSDLVVPSPNSIMKSYTVPLKTTLYILLTELAPKPIANWIHYLFDPYKDLSYLEYRMPKKDAEQMRVLTIPKEMASRILDQCRSNNVKLTALLVHVGLLAATRITGDFDTKIAVPTNCRNLIDPSKVRDEFDTAFGLFMGHIELRMPSMNKLNDTSSPLNWDVTRRIHTSIHSQVERSTYALSLMKFIDTKQFIQEQHKKQFTTTLEISNLGLLKSDLISDAWFDQPSQTTLFDMNVIGTTDQLNLCLRTYKKAWLSDFYDDVFKSLSSL